MGDYTLQTIEPDRARPDLTFTKGQCQHCPYVAQRGFAGYAEVAVRQHLRDKHGIRNAERQLFRKKAK